MSGLDFFESIDGMESHQQNDKPIWALALDDKSEANEKVIHQWLLDEINFLKEENRERFKNIQRNLALYKGAQFDSVSNSLKEDRTIDEAKRSLQRIVCNQIYDLVQGGVARLIKYRPAVAILPTQDEFQDKLGAEVTEAWLSHIQYVQRYDSEIDPEIKRLAKIMGESYLGIEWDPTLGDLDADYVEHYKNAVDEGRKVPLLNEQGHPELNEDGTPIEISAPIYNGDVKYSVWKTTDVLVHRARSWNEARYLFRQEIMEVEKARLLYPKAVDKIKASAGSSLYDYEKMGIRPSRKNEVVVWHFYHKRCQEMDKGRYIVLTNDGVLINQPLPYNHKELPCKRYTDRDLPGELHAVSGIDFVKTMTGAMNNITNMILRNQVMVAHPKWMMPAGAAKLESLGNDITIVQFKGPIAPQLVQCAPTPAEVFNFRGILKQESQEYYGLGQIQKGNPPPGIKAGIALQFLAEQESERANEDVLKANEFTRQVAVMSIQVAGDYYPNDEKRQIRILGKNSQWKTIFFNTAHLTRDYDVRVQNSSALPQSKAARTQHLIDLKQTFPTLISDEQFMDLLDLAQDNKFTDITTVSVRAAEAENEALLDPEAQHEVLPPEDFEDHVAHWQVHARVIREWSFKNMTPPLQQEKLKDHLMATEMLMVDRAKMNPIYLEGLKALKGFPVLFKPEELVPPPLPPSPLPPPPPEAPGPEMPGPAAPAPEEMMGQPGGMPGEDMSPDVGSVDKQMGVEPVGPSSAI